MADWNTLFTDEAHIKRAPEGAFYKWTSTVESLHPERPIRAWDLCCGAGRHTVAMARRGWDVHASDISETGITEARAWLDRWELDAHLAVADMTEMPWPERSFHAVISWDSIHHNTVANIRTAVANVYEHLVPGGLFIGTIKSDKAFSADRGREIEPGTRIKDVGSDAGVIHHYFGEDELRQLFRDFEYIALAEKVMDYKEYDRQLNPFGFTTWAFCLRRPTRS
ncbi:class I SAM-dependent methyltransferase [Actinoalloteichus caeruleus]|uniref:class I SAM-dependent methyltransferase n=1 Tax=Actinoalloteichus cyanogriseus TaxID=2893586 RepID=UPI003BB89B9B